MPKSEPPNLNFELLKRPKTFWPELIGKAEHFTLESRIFHSISIGLLVLMFVYIPYNFYAQLYVSSLSAFGISCFVAYQYYRSRYLNKVHNSVIFGLIGIFVLGINFFTNAGIQGSTDLIWPIYLLLVFTISPYPQHLIWLVIYVVWFLTLHIIAFYNPELVQYPFKIGKGQFIDRITAFPQPILAIYFIITIIRRSHDKERKEANEKTIALEESNAQILLQKKQLEKSNSEKNKLMSIISHDLRAPLLNIQNYLDLLNKDFMEESERKPVEQALSNATNNAIEMLANVLNWSKSQMQGSSVKLVKANLLNTLTSTLQMEKMHASKKNILLINHIPRNIDVIADLDMLQLVIRNLINNAVKFTAFGGQIDVDALVIEKNCKITVKDNGKGIDPNKQKKVFSIKSESTLGTDNEKGIGLGLVLCKEFIELQGGKIGFESNKGGGSTFFVLIPLS